MIDIRDSVGRFERGFFWLSIAVVWMKAFFGLGWRRCSMTVLGSFCGAVFGDSGAAICFDAVRFFSDAARFCCCYVADN